MADFLTAVLTAVSDLVVRPSAMTRTITDGIRHADQGETGQTYSMIECTSQEFTVASAQ